MLTSGVIRTQYSAIAFSGGNRTIIEGTEDIEGTFIPAINQPRVFLGSTRIFNALDACFDILQRAEPGPRVLVLITDGETQDSSDNTQTIKDSGVVIVTVGVGSSIDVPFLQRIATTPDLYIPASFSNLPQLSMSVARTACDAIQDIFMSPSPGPLLESPSPGPLLESPSPDPI
eukprot:IDg14015t1